VARYRPEQRTSTASYVYQHWQFVRDEVPTQGIWLRRDEVKLKRLWAELSHEANIDNMLARQTETMKSSLLKNHDQ